MKDSRTTLLASCGEGTVFSLGPILSTEFLYAGLHVVTYCSTQTFQAFIEGATSSGASWSTVGTMTALTSRSGEFTSPVAVSTDMDLFRASWTMTTSADNGAGVVIWMAIDE
jgi:hypothetical protein